MLNGTVRLLQLPITLHYQTFRFEKFAYKKTNWSLFQVRFKAEYAGLDELQNRSVNKSFEL